MHPLVAFALLLAITTAVRSADGGDHPLSRMPAFHRYARRHVPRPRHGFRTVRSTPFRSSIPSTTTLRASISSCPAAGRITLIGGLMLFVFASAFSSPTAPASARISRAGRRTATAKLMGVPVAATTIRIYALSGLLAGLSGIVFSLYTSAGYSLAAWCRAGRNPRAVVIGGTLLTGDPASLPERWSASSSRSHPDIHHVRRHAFELVDEDPDRAPALCLHPPAEGDHPSVAPERQRA